MPDNEAEESSAQQVISAEDYEREMGALLESIPEDQLADILSRKLQNRPAVIAQFTTSWRAPLPPAEMLQQYEQISPGFADRIISCSEKEQDHRHSCEKSALGASIQSSERGQKMAFGIALLMIMMTGWLIWGGHALGSTIFGGVTILGLVSLFTTGKLWPFGSNKSENSDDEEDEEDKNKA